MEVAEAPSGPGPPWHDLLAFDRNFLNPGHPKPGVSCMGFVATRATGSITLTLGPCDGRTMQRGGTSSIHAQLAAATRAAFHEEGELSAVIKVRQCFPGIIDYAQARACVRTTAGWRHPAPAAPCSVVPLRSGKGRQRSSPGL